MHGNEMVVCGIYAGFVFLVQIILQTMFSLMEIQLNSLSYFWSNYQKQSGVTMKMSYAHLYFWECSCFAMG